MIEAAKGKGMSAASRSWPLSGLHQMFCHNALIFNASGLKYGFCRVPCKPLLIFFWPQACQSDKDFPEKGDILIPDQIRDFIEGLAALLQKAFGGFYP
jgi:hypothetical protein